MKPSFTACFFSNRSRYWFLSAITALMSTSLNVVSMAAVFCASLRRRAMVCLSRVIGTRVSRAWSSGVAGARAATGVGTGCSLTTGAAVGSGLAASASALVMRPSLPVPATAAGAIPFSVRILAAAGDGISFDRAGVSGRAWLDRHRAGNDRPGRLGLRLGPAGRRPASSFRLSPPFRRP